MTATGGECRRSPWGDNQWSWCHRRANLNSYCCSRSCARFAVHACARRLSGSLANDADEEHCMAIHRSRRSFIGSTLCAGATAALLQAQPFLNTRGWLDTARAATPDLTRDTFNGLLAFVVPGSDAYSLAQGVSAGSLGGVDANATDILIATVDESTPFIPSFSAQVAAILNGLALAVNPGAS